MNIEPKELSRALKVLRPVVEARPIIPVLGNVKIVDGEVIGSNKHVSIKERISVDGSGSFLYPMTELMNFCNVSTETITLLPEKVTSGKGKCKLGYPNDIHLFPKFEESIEGVTVSVHEVVVQSIVKAAKFIHKENILPQGNVNIIFANGVFTVTGTNNMVFYQNSFKIATESDGVLFNAMLPLEFVKCLSGVTGACDITVNDSKISVTNGSTCVIGSLAEGRFPDCTRFFKKRDCDILCIDRHELADALLKVSGIYSTYPICKISFENPAAIDFYLEDYGVGFDVAYNIELAHGVKTPLVTVNATGLLELLSTLPTDVQEVYIQIEGPNKHLLITAVETDIKLIIMPLLSQ